MQPCPPSGANPSLALTPPPPTNCNNFFHLPSRGRPRQTFSGYRYDVTQRCVSRTTGQHISSFHYSAEKLETGNSGTWLRHHSFCESHINMTQSQLFNCPEKNTHFLTINGCGITVVAAGPVWSSDHYNQSIHTVTHRNFTVRFALFFSVKYLNKVSGVVYTYLHCIGQW